MPDQGTQAGYYATNPALPPTLATLAALAMSAEPAAPATPATPETFDTSNTVTSVVSINPQRLTWMVTQCKQLLLDYHSDPKASDEDQFNDLQDRIVSIEFETVDSGLEDLPDDEIDRSVRPYRRALSGTNWWAGQ